MIDLNTVHFSTLKSMKSFGLDYTKFETVDELKSELQRLRKEKCVARLRIEMRDKYRANPDKYRQMRYTNRAKEKEKNPEKCRERQREYARKSYMKKKMEKVEEFKVLELLPKPEQEYEIEFEIVD
jgi:glucose-6-phosphate isomerase